MSMPERAHPPESGEAAMIPLTFSKGPCCSQTIFPMASCMTFIVSLFIFHACTVTPEPAEPDAKMVEFLTGLGLEKYVSILHEEAVDFEALINFSDEDLKRVGIK